MALKKGVFKERSVKRSQAKVGDTTTLFQNDNKKVVSIKERLAEIDKEKPVHTPEYNSVDTPELKSKTVNTPKLKTEKRPIHRNKEKNISAYTPKKSGQYTEIKSGAYTGGYTGTHFGPYTEKQISADTPQLLDFSDLRGNPQALSLLIYELSWENEQRVTLPLSYDEITHMLGNKSAENVRSAVRWCRDQGVLLVVDSKRGPRGYVVLKLADKAFEEIDYGIKKRRIHRISYQPIPIDKLRCNSSSSSSINKNITTTNKPELVVDVSPLASIGFQTCHVEQLRGTFTSEQLQQSINHFAFALEHNPDVKNFKKPPLSVFMGVLKKGQPWLEPNYKSPDKLLYEREMADKNRKLEEQQKKMKEMERHLTNIEFQHWREKLTKEEADRIEADSPKSITRSIALREYFVKNVKKS